jgi:hypothetical protein
LGDAVRGRLVIAVVAASGLLVTASAAATDTIAFGPATAYPTTSMAGPGPGAVTTIAGDVDGDGDTDVVVTDWFGPGPIVLRNQGLGAFGPGTTAAAVSGIGALASGDFDRDGRLDLAGRTGGEVVVLLGNGDATFRVGARTSVLSNAQQAITVLDVNGDGATDIATTAATGIQVLLGRGDGSFTLGPLTPLLAVMADVKPARFDTDDNVDLAVVDATPLRARIVALRGNGNGTFTVTGGGAVGHGPEAVMTADLDGNGIDDAISVDSFSIFGSLSTFSITVLLANGQGGFAPGMRYPTGNGPVSGAAADLDGDGDIDVAVSAVGDATVTVYANDGSGRLAQAGRLPVAPFPQTPVAADLDADGRPDLAVPSPGKLAVLRNQS